MAWFANFFFFFLFLTTLPFKTVTILLEGFGGPEGIVVGLVFTIIWPTNILGSGDATPQYEAIGCALQAAINISVLESTLKAIETDMLNAKGFLKTYLQFSAPSQYDYGGRVTALNNALKSVTSAKNAALTQITGSGSLGATAILPSMVSIAYAELGILRELVVSGLPFEGSMDGYNVVAQALLQCTYEQYMVTFENLWTTFVSNRKSTISTVKSSSGSANLITITDALSGISVKAGGAFCVSNGQGGGACTGGGYPTAALDNIGTGTTDAIFNEAQAMFRLAMEPIVYLHLLVPRYASLPLRQAPSWLPHEFNLGPYSINPQSAGVSTQRIGLTLVDGNTDSSSGGPYVYVTDPKYAFASQVTLWNNNAGGTGVEVDYCPNAIKYGDHITDVTEDHVIPQFEFPVSDNTTLRFLSGMLVHVSSTNMYTGKSGNVNLGVTYTSMSFYQVRILWPFLPIF